MKLLGTKVPGTLVWPYAEGTEMYWNYYIRCVSCAVFVITGSVMCGCVYGCTL